MKYSAKHAEWVAIGFFAALGALVFQQIATSMAEQGIASGGPYDNAASYPRNIAILMLALLAVQLVRELMRFGGSAELDEAPSQAGLRRAVGLLLVFVTYLFCLDWFGYHLSTAPMAAIVMLLCGLRNPIKIIGLALAMSLVLAFVFEKILNVVLPIGIFGLTIPW